MCVCVAECVSLLLSVFVLLRADVDECLSVCLTTSETCTNVDGSYNCQCHSGFKFDPQSNTCVGQWITYKIMIMANI